MADDLPHEFGRILVGKSDIYQYLTLALGNRHGLVAGATGTGKTVTLQVLAEGFSRAGTAVFAADIKGDLAGIAMPGDSKPHFVQRAKDIGIAYAADDFPVAYWDLYGQSGHPVRARISDMGPRAGGTGRFSGSLKRQGDGRRRAPSGHTTGCKPHTFAVSTIGPGAASNG